MAPRRAVETISFGCRLNAVEAEEMRRNAEAAGHGNLVIVNTCAVTAEAVRQAGQTIRRLKREDPGRAIVVTGCGVQTEQARFAAMPEISRLIGNAEKTNAGIWRAPPGAVSDIMAKPTGAESLIAGTEDHTRAFLGVQTGCDHRCTFCIIPYGRGPSRSVAVQEVVEAAQRLAAQGFREIVLTGVDLTSYGQDLDGKPPLGALVKAVLKGAPDLPRLRLSSIDCIEIDADLHDAILHEKRLMPHLHLSLQAGDDAVLKRMARRHRRDEAVALCQSLLRARPDIVFGADLIAGFPGESDDMFANTLALVEDCSLTYLHVFPFSARAGTPAAKMQKLPGSVVKDRARLLREAGEAALASHLEKHIGKKLTVLTERGGLARTEDFSLVAVGDVEAGQMLEVEITGSDGKRLSGRGF